MMKRLSIIVPMYNVEPYVERCLRSLLNQDIPKEEYEIICINDGSPDNCKAIVERLQKEYNNIILINQENQGVSVARNNGIELASAKYLLLIDPDDYVEQDSFASAIDDIEKNDAQISFLGYTFLNEDGSTRKQIVYSDLMNSTFTGIEAYYIARRERTTDPDRMVAVLFSTEFINKYNFRFLENVPFLEDGELISRILCVAERVVFGKQSFYLRTTREGSATRSNLYLSEKARIGFFLAVENLLLFQSEKFLSIEQRQFLNQPIAKFVLLPVMAASSIYTLGTFWKVKREIKTRDLGKLDLGSCDKIYTRFGMVYNRSLKLFYIYWIIRSILIVIERRFTIKNYFIFGKLYDYLNLYDIFIIRSQKHAIQEF